MSDRKTITVSEAAYDAADADRRDSESWTEYLLRIAGDSEGEHTPNTVVAENVDEIARAAATEVENRMTRR